MHDPRALFTQHGLRCTKQRIDLYTTLAACKCHPTAEELFRMTADATPGTSLATVYNTLEAFCRAGLARRIATPNGACRYDADLHEHLHLVTGEGRVMDVPDELGREVMNRVPPSVLREVERRLGIAPDSITIQFACACKGRGGDDHPEK